jgi:hypothetical protein
LSSKRLGRNLGISLDNVSQSLRASSVGGEAWRLGGWEALKRSWRGGRSMKNLGTWREGGGRRSVEAGVSGRRRAWRREFLEGGGRGGGSFRKAEGVEARMAWKYRGIEESLG